MEQLQAAKAKMIVFVIKHKRWIAKELCFPQEAIDKVTEDTVFLIPQALHQAHIQENCIKFVPHIEKIMMLPEPPEGALNKAIKADFVLDIDERLEKYKHPRGVDLFGDNPLKKIKEMKV